MMLRIRRPRGRKAVGLAAALALLVVAVGAETAARVKIEDAVGAAAAKEFKAASVSAGIGPTPALIDLSQGHISIVSIDASAADLCQLNGVGISAQLHDVSISVGASGRKISSSNATITLDPAVLATMVAKSLPTRLSGLGTPTVVPDPADDLFQIRIGGLVTLDERAGLTGDAISLTLTSVAVGSRQIPASALGTDATTPHQRTLGKLPLGMSAHSVAVTGSGLAINLAGGATTLSPGAGDTCHQASG
jgi:hypothetical protein